MKKTRALTIVPKNNHNEITCWWYDLEDYKLAKEDLKKYFSQETHEIIETDCEEYESSEEFENACFKGKSWQ